MINNLRVALLSCSHITEQVEAFTSLVYQVKTAKNLVRLLIDREIDLIVVKEGVVTLEQLHKISQTYSVPVICLGKQGQFQSNDISWVHFCESMDDFSAAVKAMNLKIETMRVKRENNSVLFTLQSTTEFTNRVIHTTKDDFIADTVKFFKNNFKMKSCHWVAVKKNSSKLPPILMLKQELEKQKVDQGRLIKDLDDCAMEMAHEENYQIWKTSSGEYFALVWIHEGESHSQCVILNKIQIKNGYEFKSFLSSLSPFLNRRWSLCKVVGTAQQQVYKDSLTNLYNQKFLGEVVDKKIEEYKRYKTPFSILFIDVDHFKRVNDSLGHVVGSNVLTQMGGLLQKQIRNSDYAFRYGGDEFIILLSHTEGQDAVNVAERIRKEVENFEFVVKGLQVRVTVSIGLAFFPVHADSAEDIIRIADEAMYYGKNKSRNIVYKAS